MIVLLSKNKELICTAKKLMKDIIVINSILDYQIQYTENNIECDILILDVNIIYPIFQIFINWLKKTDPIIKSIIIYHETIYGTDCMKYINNLNKIRYKTNLISLKDLIEGFNVYAKSNSIIG